MIKVCVEVREGAALNKVAVYADSISQAVGITKRRFPGCDARVEFPIDGEEFFGGRGTERTEAEDSSQQRLLPARVR
jgi:hypothetical protein